MLWGAVLGWHIVSSTIQLVHTARHKGPGIVHYGDGEHSPERPERVAEQDYKRHNYVMSGLMLSLGLGLWFVVARGAREQRRSAASDRRSPTSDDRHV